LAIVRELVRALGGRVDVASDIGRGTTFRVALPVR
jgi:signal transduction histidine kinase